MIVATYNQHVRLLSSEPFGGWRFQSLLGPRSRHCYGIITLIFSGEWGLLILTDNHVLPRLSVGELELVGLRGLVTILVNVLDQLCFVIAERQ